MYSLCFWSVCLFACLSVWAEPERIWHVCELLLTTSALFDLHSLLCLLCNLGCWMVPLSGSQISYLLVYHISHHTSSWVCPAILFQVSQIMLSHPVALQRNLIWWSCLYALVLLYIHLTVNYLKCYVCKTITWLFWQANTSVVDYGNSVLNIVNGIRLPLAPESILYAMHALLWLVLYP